MSEENSQSREKSLIVTTITAICPACATLGAVGLSLGRFRLPRAVSAVGGIFSSVVWIVAGVSHLDNREGIKMDELLKNLWLLLTLAIPGMTTYGTFRLLLLLNDSVRIDQAVFEKIDASVLVTTCLIMALAVFQQAIAIAIEAGLGFVCARCRVGHESYHALFCERFKLAARGALNEDATRILGNFFLSLNVTIGQCMLLAYLVWYEKPNSRIPELVILVFIAMGLASALFRLRNAVSIVDAVAPVKDGAHAHKLPHTI